jgi:hypothetical protein
VGLSDDAAYKLVGLAVEKDMASALEAYGISAEEAAVIAAAARTGGDETLEDEDALRLLAASTRSEEEKVADYLKGVASGAVAGVMSERTALAALPEGPVGVVGVVASVIVGVVGQEPLASAESIDDDLIGELAGKVASRLLQEAVSQGLVSGVTAGELRSAFTAVLPKVLRALDEAGLSASAIESALAEVMSEVYFTLESDSAIDASQLSLALERMMEDLADVLGDSTELTLDAGGREVAKRFAMEVYSRGNASNWASLETLLCGLLQNLRTELVSDPDAFSGISTILNEGAVAVGAAITSSCSD